MTFSQKTPFTFASSDPNSLDKSKYTNKIQSFSKEHPVKIPSREVQKQNLPNENDWSKFNEILAPRGQLSMDEYLERQALFCPISDAEDWTDPVPEGAPLLKLNSERFLIPVLPFGPNNQIRGLRESMYIAIALNRTLIMPPFFKHKRNDNQADNTDNVIVHAHHRLDEAKVRFLMSASPAHNFKKVAGKDFSAMFFTRANSCSAGRSRRLETMCTESLLIDCSDAMAKTQVSTVVSCTNNKYPFYPADINDKLGNLKSEKSHLNVLKLPLSMGNIRAAYNSPEKGAALLLSPYHNFDLMQIVAQNYVLKPDFDVRQSIESGSDDLLTNLGVLAEIIEHTPRPEYIRQVAQQFITGIMKSSNFVAIHWRYNEKDWGRHCMSIDTLKNHCQVVEKLMKDHNMVGKTWLKLIEALIRKGLHRVLESGVESEIFNF